MSGCFFLIHGVYSTVSVQYLHVTDTQTHQVIAYTIPTKSIYVAPSESLKSVHITGSITQIMHACECDIQL